MHSKSDVMNSGCSTIFFGTSNFAHHPRYNFKILVLRRAECQQRNINVSTVKVSTGDGYQEKEANVQMAIYQVAPVLLISDIPKKENCR